MNLDKKLSRYAKHIDNPKYYEKILHILDKADEKHYIFKDFSKLDIIHIYDVIDGYFEVNNSYEKHKRIVKYFNTIWFIVSDKHYILVETPFLLIALSYYIRCYILLFFSKTKRLINPTHFYECNNVEWNIYLFRSALKASEFIGCDVWDLEENHIK